MSKNKHKKKNKKMKKTEIHKMQVENQQAILVDAAEKEQRRTSRLGAIIAIVAVIGTICAFLFKMTISSLNVWSERGGNILVFASTFFIRIINISYYIY